MKTEHLAQLWARREEGANRLSVTVPPGLFVEEYYDQSVQNGKGYASLWFIRDHYVLFWIDGNAQPHRVVISKRTVNEAKIELIK